MKSVKQYRTIMMCVAAFLLTASFVAVPEANAAKKKKKAKTAPVKKQFSNEDIYAQMDLSDQQQTKFNAIRDMMQAALDKWDASPKGQRLTELQVADASASNDSLIRQLESERAQVEKRFDSQLLSVLNGKQKAARLGLKFCNSITAGKLGGALKGDQVKKLKASCMQAGVAIVKGTVSPARAEARLKSIAVGMLSDDQKKKLGLRVPPKPKKVDNRKNNRRRRNKKPSKKQVQAHKKAVAAHKAAAAKKKAATRKAFLAKQ